MNIQASFAKDDLQIREDYTCAGNRAYYRAAKDDLQIREDYTYFVAFRPNLQAKDDLQIREDYTVSNLMEEEIGR